MRLPATSILFATIITGTFYTVTVAGLPHAPGNKNAVQPSVPALYERPDLPIIVDHQKRVLPMPKLVIDEFRQAGRAQNGNTAGRGAPVFPAQGQGQGPGQGRGQGQGPAAPAAPAAFAAPAVPGAPGGGLPPLPLGAVPVPFPLGVPNAPFSNHPKKQ
ncbi:hypothetical protein BC835DRAFT_1304140 [Cytidiella melzeri]|nr:hypothetical protein BC835DRAFT_442202 [Cytidiella melzeri]KAI0700278.1 hypothetical protein BC835DRAFT_1304140 [Cytidiella melzeri]